MSVPLYYAQHHEDKWIAENLGDLLPEHGFYVDIGAAHPFTASNTAFLRDRKWEGLAVDGNPTWENDWKDIPAFHHAIISPKPYVRFNDHAVPEYSRIGTEGRIRAAETIEGFLYRKRVYKFDFFSIDAEGHEYDILTGFDFKKHSPAIIICEYNTADIGEDNRICPLIKSHGYRIVWLNPVNMIFIR